MNKVKNEHYVPQCYLRNFRISGTDGKINVFDKKMEQIRLNQNISDIASERYFYDIDIDKILGELSEEKRNDILQQMGDKYEVYKNDKTQRIEKFFSDVIEGDYSQVLMSVVEKAEKATPWHINNCYCMSEREKVIMSVCITIQFMRTKKQRKVIEEIYTKGYKTLLTKLYNIEYGDVNGKLSPDDFQVKIGKEGMKLTHAEIMLNSDMLIEFINIFLKHIWIIYINRTDVPFCTSDSPIVLNNPERNEFRSGTGIASKGIEIYLPLNKNVLLMMVDRKKFEDDLYKLYGKKDRLYIELFDSKLVNMLNEFQLKECFRCIYSGNSDLKFAEELCKRNPKLKEDRDYVSVG